MRFAEELVLLLLNKDTGYFVPVPEWKMSCALAGSVLIDLSLENRIDADLDSILLLDATPTGDSLLDPSLRKIAEHPRRESSQYWVERIARHSHRISTLTLDRLVKSGVLTADEGGFWSLTNSVARTKRYPGEGGAAAEEIQTRIMRLLFSEEIPAPRDIAIISLVNCCGGMAVMLSLEEYALAKDRIEFLSGMDLIGRAIAEAVRSSYRPPASSRSVRRRPLPTVSMLDMLASRTFRSGNLPKFMAEKSKELGPVFRLRAGRRSMVVLAGTEANLWVRREGRFHLRTRDYLEEFQQEWGSARSIASMDGAEHFRMRKAVRAGNSRSVVEDRMDEVFSMARRTFASWGIGKTVPGEMGCQRLIGAQVARLSASIDPTDALDALLKFEYRAVLVHVLGLLPRILLRTPAMRRARNRVFDLYARIHAAHTSAQRRGKRRDLVDDLMALHHSDPQFLPETDLGFAFIAPIIAGHYLGSAATFAVYEMMANPHFRDQLAAEADALFSSGDPTAECLDPARIDVARRFTMETLRLHPVVAMHLRTAMNAFEICGMEVPAYSNVLVAFTASHFDDKHFPKPDNFDIGRYASPRNEHRQAGAYVPFGVGTHTCGGAGWAELHLVLNLLLIARHLDLQMVPADYQLRISPLPKLSPDKRFGFRVVRHRHPIGPDGAE